MNKTSEYHVTSFIAHSLPRGKQALANEIKTIEGAEVHAISNEGKIVFTVEANDQRLIANRVDQIRYHDELLSLSPIYHQFLTEEQSY